MKERINTQYVASEIKRYRESAAIRSAAERDGRINHIENSPLSSFEQSFVGVIPEGERLGAYVERVLADRAGRAIGLELGGVGSRLFAGFTPGFFERTAGVNLTDYRPIFSSEPKDTTMHRDRQKIMDGLSRHKTDAIIADISRNHRVIEGDMLATATSQQIEEEFLRGDKVNFMIRRMAAGNFDLPTEPFFLAKNANRYYQMMGENSVLFDELPTGFWNLSEAWSELVNTHYSGRLIAYVADNKLLLHKGVGAPKKLPVFSVSKVREIVASQGKFSTLRPLFTTPA